MLTENTNFRSYNIAIMLIGYEPAGLTVHPPPPE